MAAALAAALRLCTQRGADAPGRVLRRPEDIAEIARAELAGCRRERALVLVCDSGNRLRQMVRLTDGSVDRTLLPVRETLNAVLRHDGRAFAVAHNHPPGDPSPTEQDQAATTQLADAARTVGLRFLGHVVLSHDGWRLVAIA